MEDQLRDIYRASLGAHLRVSGADSQKQLTDPNGKPIASMRTRTFHDSTLHVSQHALPMLDMLVVTLMIFWGIQDRQRRAAAASAASSGGASG